MATGGKALELLNKLADKSQRAAAADAVAHAVGCDAFYLLVWDDVVGAFLPAPGFAQTLPSAAWRQVVDCCRRAGEHRIDVRDGNLAWRVDVRCRSNAALLFVGDVKNGALAGALADALPVIAAIFGSEQAAVAAAGQLTVAHDAARHARLLSAALSTARSDTERALADAARLNAELRTADRRKDEFLAMLAHELRNPLAPIVTALQLVNVRRERGETFDHELDVMARQLSHLARLVDDLLDVSRITRNRVELRVEVVQLAEVIRQAIVTAQPLLDDKQHALAVDGLVEDIYVVGDFVRLVQVFANLLNNAAKYTDRGGRIEIRASRRDETVTVCVADNGIGIAPDMLPQVFDLFAQAPRSLDRSQGGLGIGLTLVKALVEMQGGSVTAHSAGEGRGSEFSVSLPTVAAPRAEVPRSEPRAQVAEMHVLVVDDNTDSAEMLADILRMWGHTVQVASDGVSALRLADQHAFDVFVLDIGLPQIDGFEVGRRLRRTRKRERIIALSGYGDAAHRHRAEEAGFDAYLVKPVDPTALREVLFGPPRQL